MNNLVQDFLQNGYFKYPLNQTLLRETENLAKLWKIFCLQSRQVKERHVFSDYSGGYEYKESPDFKENFHISPLYEIPGNSTSTDVAFVLAGKQFIRSSLKTVRPMIDIMSEALNMDMTTIVCQSIESWTVRCLHYFPRNDNPKFLAIAHIDKGITTHFYEDLPGLQVLWDGKWINVASQHNQIHGYFGMLGQYYAECSFPALTHRVVPSKKTNLSGRNSIVLFSDFGNVRYDKAQFGSTQLVFPNGENYYMSFEEFKKYFIKI